jgi:hypothetical protein
LPAFDSFLKNDAVPTIPNSRVISRRTFSTYLHGVLAYLLTTDVSSNVTSEAIISNDFDDEEVIAKEEDETIGDLAELPNNRGDLMPELRQALTKAASKAGLLLNASNLPWAKLLQICGDNDIYIDNYPASVQLPGTPGKGAHSKGIGNLIKQERLDLIKAINAPKNALKFIKARNLGGKHS